MILTSKERKVFWKNWLSLLAFVNDVHEIDGKFGHPNDPVGINTITGYNISERLFSDINIIDEFIDANTIIGEDKELLLSWKKYIKSTFIALKQLRKYCVLYDEKSKNWYGINGITTSLEETIPVLPCIIKTTLLPFNDKIIYNSFMENQNIIIGKNMERELLEEYIKAKVENRIIDKF
jgi:hypothetical protein